MGASQATSGYATVLQDNSSGSFASVAEVVRIVGPKKTRKFIDVTNLTSPSEAMEWIPGLLEAGSVTLTLNYLPGDATQKRIGAALDAASKLNFKIILSDALATTITFTGYYESIEPTAPHDNKLSLNVTIKVTGIPVFPS